MTLRSPNYKELTYSQLRSFCQTARLGGMAAAADALGVTQPTVWKQIHSLEDHLGVTLVEPHTRGCRLTDAGQLLLRLADPIVNEVESLWERFEAAVGKESRQMVVAVPPRPCEEELIPCVSEYERRYAHVRLVLRQVADRSRVIQTVEGGQADMGLVALRPDQFPEGFRFPKGLHVAGVYELEPVLLVPRGHPLQKATLRLEHFAKYPLLNSRESYPDPGITAALEAIGAYKHTGRTVELDLARTIRQYVRYGLGIGIVARPLGWEPLGDVVERPLKSLFPSRLTAYAFYRSRVTPDPELLGFIEVLRDELAGPKRNSERPGSGRRLGKPAGGQ